MLKASDEDICAFFDETIFEGVFSKEVRSNYTESFKGHIHSIKVNGVSTNVIGTYVNVPISANDIPEGPCTFKCRLKENVRKSPSQINFYLAPRTLRVNNKNFRYRDNSKIEEAKNTSHNQGSIAFSPEEESISNYWQLGKSKRFIGLFEQNVDKTGYIISDIRRPEDFTKVDNKLTIEVDNRYVHIPKNNAYYSFQWLLLEYDPERPKFGVQRWGGFYPIKERNVVEMLHNQIMAYPPGAAEKAVKTIDILRNQLTASGKEIFIYELLQNANDYPLVIDGKKQMVDVEFHITRDHLFFLHSGRMFNERNVAAICGFNDREKTANSEAIGYKGIGFKTVFAYNNYVYLQSGAYSFRFDWEENKHRKNTPWQILPIPTKYSELAPDIKYILSNAHSDFRVRFAMRPTEKDTLRVAESNYVELFQKTFDSERVILFIPYINTVKVFFHDDEITDICRTRSSETWCVSEDKKYVGDIPDEITVELNRRIEKQDGKIPEKYLDFKKTSIGFACKKNGRFLEPIEDSCLYCYLPAKKAQWGLGFLLNTDMIPIGTRENVEPKEKVNHVISKIAGQQFFHWIQDLIKSGEYDYDSILSLIPDFDKLIENTYDEDIIDFLNEFKEGFEEELLGENGKIIPIINEDGDLDFVKVNQVNYDTLGITCCNIISDEDLLRIVQWSDCFVHPDLRDYDKKTLKTNISRILEIYVGQGYTFDNDDILDNCENQEFRSWLKEESNCNNFLAFLLEKGFLVKYKSKAVFPEDNGGLSAAEDLYENIDEFLPYLKAFNEFLPRFATHTREILSKFTQWADVSDSIFQEFDADNFVDDVLLDSDNIDRTKEILSCIDSSVLFYDFLAKYVGFADRYKGLPFISHKGKPIEDFKGFVYFPNSEAEALFEEEWIDQSWFSILSNKYTDNARVYFKDNFDVLDFSLKGFVDNILNTDESREYLAGNEESHPSFIRYCYEHQDLFGKYSLKDFALLATNKDGETEFILTEDLIYFNENNISEAQAYSWIQPGWFYSLSEVYLIDEVEDSANFKEFLSFAFGVRTFTLDVFIKDIVLPKAQQICDNIGGTDSSADTDESIEVLQFLGENHKVIAQLDGFSKFTSIHLYRYDEWGAIKDREIPVFLYDEDLKLLLNEEWTPVDFAYMLEERYNEEIFDKYPTLKKHLSIKIYTFEEVKKEFVKAQSISEFVEDANEKEKNLSIHRFFYSHSDELLAKDYKELAKIPLLVNGGGDDVALVSDIVYMPDYLMPIGKGIESIVTKYVEALFVSTEYVQTDNLNDKETIGVIQMWNNYLSSLGVLSKIQDLIINSVLPNLADTEDDNILTLLGDYYDDIHKEEEWNKHLKELKKLPVRSGDVFIPISEAVFIDSTASEPFPSIAIPNQIAPSYSRLKGNSAKLLSEIIDATTCKRIEDLDSWRKAKLDRYVLLQSNNPATAIEVNISLISEIVRTYSDKVDLYRPYIKQLKLLNSSKQLCNPSELTEGSAYNPVCDFLKFGFNLNYISDDYITSDINLQSLKNFLRDLKVVYAFKSIHLQLLSENYTFAKYFWTEYVTKAQNFEHIKTFVDDLNKYAIIPAAQPGLMKKPSELYAWYLIDKYVKGKIDNSEAFTPLETLFYNGKVKSEILEKLHFGTSLNPNHCLEALLTCTNKDDRKDILRWLTDKKNVVNRANALELYNREDFKWQTGKGDRNRRALKELLVLDFNDFPTRQLFGKSDFVLSWTHFNTTDIFEAFCFIFSITPISISKDFIQSFMPQPETYDYKAASNAIKRTLKLPLLILAASIYPDSWLEKYQEFCERIEAFDFIKCESISIEYKDILSNTNIHYHRDSVKNRIYFVENLKTNRVFQKFVEDIDELLELEGDKNQTEEIFDTTEWSLLVDELIDEDIKRDEEFRSICKDLSLMVVVDEQIEEEPDEVVITPPSFGQSTTDELQDDTGSEDVDVSNIEYGDKDNLEEEICSFSSQVEMDNGTPTDNPVAADDKPEVEQDEAPDSELQSDSSAVSDKSILDRPTDKTPKKPTTPPQKTKEPSYVGDDHAQEKFDKASTPQRRRPLDYEDWRPKRRETHDIEHYNPDKQKPRNVVGWKKDIPQAELGVADVTEEEASAITNLIGGSKSLNEIIDEHLVVRYRMYHALKEKGYTPNEGLSEFLRNKKNDNTGVQTNNGYIHTRSAKGGILFLSGILWRELVHNGGRICMYYGNKAYDFEIIDSVEKLISFVGRDNIIIQVSGENKENIINSIFSGQVDSTNAHILIRIKSNSRYNSMFETTYNADDDNDFSIS
ncbi:hypothetical protein [Bacteroides acidifaciens]|uniref:sacsin N-terminal ATP-binding-like domain-containing protein n=1 Tax=Bacteroides acidifaciens TaxID=85831 RepID=UPI00255821B0|nr:hypothetical protein [Bacteroides acidifaciens]